MDRRAYLAGAVTTGLVGAAGCLGAIDDLTESGDPNTVLGPPDQDISASSHPTYGDAFPSVSLPDPLTETTVSTADFQDDRAFLFTFVYSNCHDGACQLLLSRLAHAQQAAAEAGLTDDTAFVAMTFDPDRDTADVLRAEGNAQGVEYDDDNWHFLRPDDFESAATILDEEFGLALQRSDLEAHDGDDHSPDGEDEHSHDGGDDQHHDDDHSHNGEGDGHHDDEDDHQPETHADDDSGGPDNDGYDIMHYNLILLVNDRGYVERAYPNATSIEWETISDDLVTVAGE